MSAGENLNMPTTDWPYGYGGAGANAPEYDRRITLLARLRAEYLAAFPGDAPFINAGVDPVPLRWINKRLEEHGESWRVPGMRDGGYIMPMIGADTRAKADRPEAV